MVGIQQCNTRFFVGTEKATTDETQTAEKFVFHRSPMGVEVAPGKLRLFLPGKVRRRLPDSKVIVGQATNGTDFVLLRCMLQLRNISKAFGNHVAVHPTDLTVKSGKTTALLGQSGCGKSTLLRMIIGLIPPDTGSVIFDNAEITHETLQVQRRRMGYVIQEGGLFPHLTAEQNITIVARFLQWSAERIVRRLEDLLELTHFPADGLARFPMQLSGGQRQRVSLMRALMLDPDLLLLDEPLGALDPMIRADLQSDLREIFRALGKTVVLVTHDIGEAGFLADGIVLMRDGRTVQQGKLADLVHAPSEPFVTDFINAHRGPLDSLDANK